VVEHKVLCDGGPDVTGSDLFVDRVPKHITATIADAFGGWNFLNPYGKASTASSDEIGSYITSSRTFMYQHHQTWLMCLARPFQQVVSACNVHIRLRPFPAC
jgi:hypothetical protein